MQLLKQTQSFGTVHARPIPMTLNGVKVQKGLALKVPLYSRLTKTFKNRPYSSTLQL